VNRDGLSARDVALLVLERRYPSRISRDELLLTLGRNGFTRNNALMALVRTKHFTDDDGQGNLLLRGNGRQTVAGLRARGKM
jgi:hypothetical protein